MRARCPDRPARSLACTAPINPAPPLSRTLPHLRVRRSQWVDCSRLRPIPPPNPTVPTAAAWTRKLTNGDFVELNYEQGWWEVQYLSRAGANLSVLAVKYGKVHQVTASGLRPGWKCLEGGTWQYALGGVARPADEWAGILATKPASGKARSSLDPAVAAAHTANSPLGRGAASNPAAGGVVGAEGEVGSFKWGVAVEVMSGDDAAGRGCWVPGEVLRVMGGDGGADGADGADAPQQLLVTWLAECDPPNATTDVEKARPAAPPPPAGWAANLRPGEPLDLYHDGAWWEGAHAASRARDPPDAPCNLPDAPCNLPDAPCNLPDAPCTLPDGHRAPSSLILSLVERVHSRVCPSALG